jgi:hypothetical protein
MRTHYCSTYICTHTGVDCIVHAYHCCVQQAGRVAAASAKAAAAEAALVKRRKREAAAARGVKLQQAAHERDKLLALNQVQHAHTTLNLHMYTSHSSNRSSSAVKWALVVLQSSQLVGASQQYYLQLTDGDV